MIIEGLIHEQNNLLRRRIGKFRIGGRGGELRDPGLILTVNLARVVHEETPVLGILRMENQTDEAQFPAGDETLQAGDVKEKGWPALRCFR